MTAQILAFKPRKRPGRIQAIRWLAVNSVEFPNAIENGIGPNLFFGWRFIQSTDGVIYFADCIHSGIEKDDLRGFIQLHSIR